MVKLVATDLNDGTYLGGANNNDDAVPGADGEEEEKGDKNETGNDNAFIPKALHDKIGKLERSRERLKPARILINKELITTGTSRVKMVAVGAMHAMAILENDNGVYAWGKNSFGQCGTSKAHPEIFQPTKIKAFGIDQIIK